MLAVVTHCSRWPARCIPRPGPCRSFSARRDEPPHELRGGKMVSSTPNLPSVQISIQKFGYPLVGVSGGCRVICEQMAIGGVRFFNTGGGVERVVSIGINLGLHNAV